MSAMQQYKSHVLRAKYWPFQSEPHRSESWGSQYPWSKEDASGTHNEDRLFWVVSDQFVELPELG